MVRKAASRATSSKRAFRKQRSSTLSCLPCKDSILASLPPDCPMPLDFHYDRARMFELQARSTREYIVPFIQSEMDLQGKEVLEIGCAEGGVLRPFLEAGARITGVDISARVNFAPEQFPDAVAVGRASFIHESIYDDTLLEKLRGKFDLVLMRDTIEHLPDRPAVLQRIRQLLKPGGLVFVAFPPWYMPFGGHQQMAETKLGKLPYLHLLPREVYKGYLKLVGEEKQIQNLMEVHETQITLRQFKHWAKEAGYRIVKEQLYLVNPSYKYKFGIEPVGQLPGLRALPVLRDFVTTTAYYLLRVGE